jgi:AraC family transcriptional regulator of adaptative response / DNA-3-methyladenine glycosylase II
MIGHLAARAISGVEAVEGDVYRRSLAFGRQLGYLEVRHEPGKRSLAITVHAASALVPRVVAPVRRMFDVDADVVSVAAHLARDPGLSPLIALRPGLRVPGGFDGFELAIRAILGQQVTIGAARQLAGRLVALCGFPLGASTRRSSGLTHAFPTPERLAAADLGALGMPAARRAALQALAEATLRDPDLFRPEGSLEEKVARLLAIRGIGDWTAHYVALRALRDPDAFPSSDIGLLRGAARAGGERPTPAELLRRAEAWRPFRAYAAQHLWAADAAHPATSRTRGAGSPRKPREGKHDDH